MGKFGRRMKKPTSLTLVASLLFSILTLITASPAHADPITATGPGSNPSVCNQEVNVTTGVTAERLANGDCLVKFSSAATINWTVPSGVTSAKVLIIGGGGGGGGGSVGSGTLCSDGDGGAGRVGGGGGGGGGGQVRDNVTISNLTSSLTVVVGSGGSSGGAADCGTQGNAGGTGGAGGTSSITTSGALQLVAAQGGTGGGGGNINGAAGSGGSSKNSSGTTTSGGAPLSTSTCTDAATNGCFAGGGGASGSGDGASPTLSGSNGVDTSGAAGRAGVAVSALISGTYGGGGGGGNRHPLSPPSPSSRAGGSGGSGGGGAGSAEVNGGSGSSFGGGGGGGRGNGAYSAYGSNATSGGAGYNGFVVISYTPDTTSPTYLSSSVTSNGTQIILTYSETLSATTAATSAFTVTAAGISKSISSISTSGATILLNLSSSIKANQVVTFTYTEPTGADDVSAIQDIAGNDAATRSSTTVTNNSTVQVAQSALIIASNQSTKSYPYSQLLTLSTSGGSGSGGVSFAITTGGSATNCALSADTATVTLSASSSGTCLIAATKAAADEYLSAVTATPFSFSFTKASQSAITITSTLASYGSNLTLTSSGGSSGGTFTYTKVSGDCTISGSTLTPTSAGSCIIYSALATDINYLAETSTATTITISNTSVGASIALDAGTLIYREVKTIRATTSVAGKVTFKVNGKRLAGCINKSVSSLNSYIATCSYRPSTRGFITISTTLVPTDTSYLGTTTTSARLFVVNRSARR